MSQDFCQIVAGLRQSVLDAENTAAVLSAPLLYYQ